MSAFLGTLRNMIEATLSVVDLMPPFVALTIISIVSGVIMLGVFALVTPPHWLKRSRELSTAAMYEIRLYLDSPVRVLKAQARLIGWSLAYTAAMMPAFIVLGLPFGLLLLHMESRYGLDPLPQDEPVLVRVKLASDVDVEPQPSEHLEITAPVLYDRPERSAYVRVELKEREQTELQLKVGDDVVTKRIDGAAGHAYSPDRAKGLALTTAFTLEPPIDHPEVRAIHVDHPAQDQGWIPFGMPWWLYWLIVATVAAVALHKPLGVTL